MASIPIYLKFWLTLGLLYALKPGVWCLDTGLNFTVEPRDAVTIKNEPFLLNCSVSNDSGHGEPANITWHKDGVLVNDARRTVLSNGSLYFQRFIAKRQRSRSDEGYYECVARNHIGTILSRKALIQVASFSGLHAGSEGIMGVSSTEAPLTTAQGLSRISGDETSRTVTIGEVVRFNCSIEASPQPVYSWEKDRTPLPQNDRYIFLPSGVLEIQRAQAEDAGRYRCSASVGIEMQKGRPLELIVQDSGRDAAAVEPTLLSPTDQHYTRNENSSVILECAASGFPQPSVVWTRNDGSSVDSSRHRILGQGNLEITSLTLQDADDYVCTVTSPLLTVPIVATATLTMRSLEPPYIITRQENLEHRLPKAVTLINEFGGTPEPTYTWFKDGQALDGNGRTRTEGPRLTITQTDLKDSGYYQCRAENEAGMTQTTMRLLVILTGNSPTTPANLTATEWTATSVALAWESSESSSGEPIVAYTVHHRDETNAGLEFQKVVRSTELVIENLKPHTNYSFYVVAYVPNGASPHSSTLIQMTRDAVPRASPIFRVKPLGAMSLKVEWEDLLPHVAQGVITGYKVIYRLHNEITESVVEYLQSTEREFIITGLEPNEKYDVRVSAGTSAGYYADDSAVNWPWLSAITTRRSESGAPDQPQVSAQVLNSTAIRLQWEIAPSGPVVDGYQLNFREVGEQQQQHRVQFDDASVTSYTIRTLKASTWYQISFLAENEFGESEPDVIEVATLGDEMIPPMAPDPVQVGVVSSTAISISWPEPQSTLTIVSYDIRYRVSPDHPSSNPGDEFTIQEVSGNVMSTNIHDLSPFTDYEFSVRAHTEQGYGPYSRAFSCRTYEEAPSAPQHALGNLINSQTVQLSWQSPAQSNGAITYYLILYSKNRSLDEEYWKSKTENGSQLTSLITGLDENVVYYFKVKASTAAGFGPDSSILTISTEPAPLTTTTFTVVPGPNRHTKDKEKQMGIIVGVTIALAGCSVGILILIILRSKCYQPRPTASQAERIYIPPQYNGVVTNINGNGYLGHGNSRHNHEMDSFLPILHGIPENEQSDTKGGYIMLVPPTPPQNGLMPNGLCVKYLQNGQVTTSLTHNSDEDGPGPQVPLRSTSLSQESCPAEEDDEGGGEDEGGGGYPWQRQSSLDGIDHEDPEPSHPGESPITDSPGRPHGAPQYTSTPLRASDHARSSPCHSTAAQPRTTSLHSQRGAPPTDPAHIDSEPTSRSHGGGSLNGRPANVDRVGPSSQDDYSGRHRQNTQQVL